MNVAYTLGRIFIPIVFLVSGIQKVMNIGEIAQMLAANGVPIPDEIVPYLSYLGGIPKYEALGYLIEGDIELVIDGTTYRMSAGDSFFFKAYLTNQYRNVGTTVARIIWVNTPQIH